MKSRLMKSIAAGAAVLAIPIILIPTHIKISSRCVVKPLAVAEVRAGVDGFVREVLVQQNDSVTKGQLLARLQNPELEEEVATAAGGLDMLNRQMAILHTADDSVGYQMKATEKSEIENKHQELQKKQTLLEIRSPLSGKVVTPHLDQKKGLLLEQGDVLCRIDSVDKVKVEIPFREYYVENIEKGQKVMLRLDSYPTQSFEGEVISVSPAIRDRIEALEGTYTEFMATAVVDNAGGKLIPGMQGEAKILSAKRSIGGRIVYELRRWVQSRIW